MIKLATALLMVFVNLILFFLFGSLITGRFKKTGFSATISIITGFFVMLIVFDLCCFPVMLKWRPLSLLSGIWLGVTLVLCILAIVTGYKSFKQCFKEIGAFAAKNRLFTVGVILLVLVQLVIIGLSYDFTLDASYYVARVTTDVTTDTINIYDPYTGEWTDHFEFRYFFSTYPTLCAVVCSLTGIHPLTGEKVYVPRDPHEKAIQRALIQYRNPANRALVLEGLKKAGRMDLVGFGPKCLIRPERKTPENRKAPGKKRKASDHLTNGQKKRTPGKKRKV